VIRLAEKTRVLEQLYATLKELKDQFEASQRVRSPYQA
jgi:hypothetical protein